MLPALISGKRSRSMPKKRFSGCTLVKATRKSAQLDNEALTGEQFVELGIVLAIKIKSHFGKDQFIVLEKCAKHCRVKPLSFGMWPAKRDCAPADIDGIAGFQFAPNDPLGLLVQRLNERQAGSIEVGSHGRELAWNSNLGLCLTTYINLGNFACRCHTFQSLLRYCRDDVFQHSGV